MAMRSLIYGTNPLHPDTDVDSMIDDDEITAGTDPLDPDPDDDGIQDGVEASSFFNTDPLDPDTDDDGFLDGVEATNGWDPLDECNPTACGP
jgi:Bacterial TSP3 repeat